MATNESATQPDSGSSFSVENTSKSVESIALAAQALYMTVEDKATAVIREAILSGVYVPGEKLGQDHLAKTVGVSRIPIRSALRQLEAEGLVQNIPHRGAFVRQLSAAEIGELYELRIALESLMLKRVAEKATSTDLKRLESLAESLDNSAGVHSEVWMERRQKFYEALHQVSELPRTAQLIEQLRAEVGRYWLSVRVRAAAYQEVSHVQLVEFIRMGDAAGGERWLRTHLTLVSLELQRLVGNPKPS